MSIVDDVADIARRMKALNEGKKIEETFDLQEQVPDPGGPTGRTFKISTMVTRYGKLSMAPLGSPIGLAHKAMHDVVKTTQGSLLAPSKTPQHPYQLDNVQLLLLRRWESVSQYNPLKLSRRLVVTCAETHLDPAYANLPNRMLFDFTIIDLADNAEYTNSITMDWKP